MAEKFGPYRPEPITRPEAPKLGDVGYIDNQIDEWIKKSKPEEKVKISTEQTALKTERDQDRKLLVQDVQAQSSGLSVEFTEQALAVTKEKMKEWKEKASSDPEAARNLLMAQVSDLDGKSGVEIRNNFHLFGKNDQKYGAGEVQLFAIFQQHSDLFDAFRKEVGSDDAKKIRDALLQQVDMLSSIQRALTGEASNGSVDIITALSGKDARDTYVNTLIEKRGNFGTDIVEGKGDKKWFQKIIPGLLSMGISVATLGKVYARYEERELKNGHPLSLVLGKGPQNLTVKLAAVSAVVQGNINDSENKIIHETKRILDSIQKATDSTGKVDLSKIEGLSEQNKGLIEKFNEKPVADKAFALAEAVAYNAMIEQASHVEQEGWNFKGVEASYDLSKLELYGGVSFQKITTEYRKSDAKVARGVADSIASPLEQKDVSKFVKFSTEGNTHIYSLRGDLTKQIPGSTFDKDTNTTTYRTPDTLKVGVNVSIDSDGNKHYQYNIIKQENKIIETSTDMSQEVSLDSSVERNLDRKLESSIYSFTRKDPEFSRIMKSISEGDYDKAYANLLKNKKYSGIVRALWDPTTDTTRDEMLNALLTYSYGTDGVMRREKVDKALYNKARSEKVLKAEKAMVDSWAPGANVTINEPAFKDIPEHKSTQLNAFYTSQALSVSVVATPSDTSKNHVGAGIDRVDNFDASIAVSSKPVELTNDKIKEAILGSHKTELASQLQKINSFFKTSVSMDDYKAVILGTKTPETVLPGLEFTQKPAFFEARAMVRDNACMNLTYGLAYPTFRYKAKVQKVEQAEPTASLNVNAPSLAPDVKVQEIAVGMKIGSEDTPDTPHPEEKTPDAASRPNATPADGGAAAPINTPAPIPTPQVTPITRR